MVLSETKNRLSSIIIWKILLATRESPLSVTMSNPGGASISTEQLKARYVGTGMDEQCDGNLWKMT